MNYNELSKETKLFLNKAMDIYSVIKDRNITRIVKTLVYGLENHEFTKLDKKVLSLFIAGFLVDGQLKEIFSQYDDIKLENLFDFINIKESDITPIPENQHENFFESNFKIDLITIIEEGNLDKKVNFITPEVVISSLQHSSLYGVKILDYFAYRYGISKGIMGFSEHPLFKALNNHTLSDSSITKDSPKRGRGMFASLFSLAPSEESVESPYKQLNKKQSSSINLDDESIWLLLDEIQKKFIGQETAAEGLFYNIVNNQQLAQTEGLPDGQRSIIFLDGPTGTGKTAITREITEKLGIPFTSSSITNYSSTGYVGGNLTDVLKELYKKAGGNLEKAQRGIIVFDEFDKIAYSRSGGLEMKRAVQQQLLDFLGGGKYTLSVGDSIFDMKKIEFDTSKLTFVCLGALTNLRSQKTEKKQPIGFSSSQQSDHQDYTITPQDLIEIGLERELVGRFNTYLHTNDYSREDLTKILKESTISPLIGFRQWIESRGKKLQVDDDVYSLIVDQAYELNTGARSLQTVMNNIRTHFIKEVLRGPSETIILDAKTVIEINKQNLNRKGRI